MLTETKSAARRLRKSIFYIDGYLSTVLIAVVLISGCGSRSELELIASAKVRLAKSDSVGAVLDLKSALQKNPTSAEARFLLGKSLLDQGDGAAALLELQKAKQFGYANDADLQPALAQAMLFGGKAVEVVEQFASKRLSSDSAQAALLTVVAQAHTRLNKIVAAEAAVAEALKADPKNRMALLTSARLAAVRGDFASALAMVEQATVAGQANGDAWMLRAGILLYSGKDDAGAIAAYRLAIQDAKYSLAAHSSIVNAYLALQKPLEAKKQLEELKKAFPTRPQTFLAEAQVAYNLKDYSKAREVMQPVLRLAPNNPKLLAFSGAIELKLGALLAAESLLGKAVLSPEEAPRARRLLADTYLRMGQAEKALSILRPLLDAGKPDSVVLAYAGEAHLQSGNTQQAVAMFAAASKLDPKDVHLRTSIAITDLVKGNAEVAFDALRNIAASDPSEVADLALISARVGRRQFEAALEAIARLEKKQPDKPTAASLRGQVLRNVGDGAGARAAFEAAIKIEPSHVGATLQLASLDVAERKLDAARLRLDAAIKLNPSSSALRLSHIEVLDRQGASPSEISGALAEAIKANSTDAASRIAQIGWLLKAKDIKGAMLAAQAAQAVLPEHPAMLEEIGRVQSEAGDDQQAITTFGKLAALQPRSPIPHIRLAEIYARRKDDAARTLSVKRAFAVAPNSALVHRHLVLIALQTKNPKIALDSAKDMQKREPRNAAAFMLEGDVAIALKNWPAALIAYKQALEKEDSSGLAAVRVYQTYAASARPVEAEQFAAQWLKRNPKDLALLARLGSDAFNRNDFALAEQRYRGVLAIEPNDVLALNNVAWMMSVRDAKGALVMAERAAKLAPQNALVLDTLARCLAAAGELTRAIDVQRHAVDLNKERFEYRLNLAKLLIKSDDKVKARVELEALTVLGAKYVGQAEVSQLIKGLSK